MIKMSVFYPAEAGTRFDHDYYSDKHLPLIAELLGEACAGYAIDKGLSGAAPDTKPLYVAMCHIFGESLDSLQAGFAAHAERINGDVAHYTDIQPIVQISEVVEC